jgi:hypothetical protein
LRDADSAALAGLSDFVDARDVHLGLVEIPLKFRRKVTTASRTLLRIAENIPSLEADLETYQRFLARDQLGLRNGMQHWSTIAQQHAEGSGNFEVSLGIAAVFGKELAKYSAAPGDLGAQDQDWARRDDAEIRSDSEMSAQPIFRASLSSEPEASLASEAE